MADARRLEIKCPRCGTLYQKADEPPTRAPRGPGNWRPYGKPTETEPTG